MEIRFEDHSEKILNALNQAASGFSSNGFSDEFIREHTGGKFNSYLEFVSACPSFKNGEVDDDELENHVADNTDFGSFQEMLKAAIISKIQD